MAATLIALLKPFRICLICLRSAATQGRIWPSQRHVQRVNQRQGAQIDGDPESFPVKRHRRAPPEHIASMARSMLRASASVSCAMWRRSRAGGAGRMSRWGAIPKLRLRPKPAFSLALACPGSIAGGLRGVWRGVWVRAIWRARPSARTARRSALNLRLRNGGAEMEIPDKQC
jgi:hypothetical protein